MRTKMRHSKVIFVQGSEALFCGIVLVLALGLVAEVAKADFIFGEPTNLGPNVNSSVEEGGPCISADGLSLYVYDFLKGWGNGTLRMATRETIEDPWGQTVSLKPPYNYGTAPCISADGLSLYLDGAGAGGSDILVSKRPTVSDAWSEPINLGTSVNSNYGDMGASISVDGLELFFGSNRIGGSGDWDVYVTTRTSVSAPWGSAENLGSTINSSGFDGHPCISSDGLVLFITSNRPGGQGDWDIWMTKRATRKDEWSTLINLGPNFNTSAGESEPSLSSDGRTLYFSDWYIPHAGGQGKQDLWQVSIEPVCDLNSDLKVDLADMHIMVDHWGENYPLCDIGPTPIGDGIVDIQDLTVLARHLYRLTAHWQLDETEGSIAVDSFGDYDGTLNGNPFWQPTGGMKGGSLMLDGIDGYVSTPFILDPAKGAFSVLAWIYSWMPGQVIISQTGDFGGTWLGTNASGMLMTGFSDVNFGALESESFITDVQWHHVGFVYDTDTLHRRLYVDGILVAEDTSAVSGIPSDGGLYIGASKDLDADTLFSGFIDDVRIYNQALSAEEIETLAK